MTTAVYYVAVCQIHESSPHNETTTKVTDRYIRVHGEPRVEIVASSFQHHPIDHNHNSSSDEDESFRIDQSHFENYARYKLRVLAQSHHQHTTGFYTYFESSLGSWHVKGLNEVNGNFYIYVVATAVEYSPVIASECLDDLSETFQKVLRKSKKKSQTSVVGKLFNSGRKGFQRLTTTLKQSPSPAACEDDDSSSTTIDAAESSKANPNDKEDEPPQVSQEDLCCQCIAERYGCADEGGLPCQLHAQMDDEFSRNAEKMQDLFRKVDRTKDQLNENILRVLENIEKAENLKKLGDDLLDQAKVFKKKAKKLKWRQRIKNYGPISIVLALGSLAGFLAGGPAGAVVLTGMESVAAAQAIEAGVGALIAGTGYLGAWSAADRWTFKQKFIFL